MQNTNVTLLNNTQSLHFCVNKTEHNLVLRDFLRKRGVSLSLVRSAKTHGGFFANGAAILANQSVKQGQNICFNLPKRLSEGTQCQQLPFNIICENEHLMAIDKAAGVTVHPTWGYPNNTLANAFCGEMQSRGNLMPFRAINRIDKNTSGIVLCAMNEYATPLLANSSGKIYLAVVQGKTKSSGEINLPIGLKEGSFIVRCVREDGKKSITQYKTLWQNNTHSLVAVKTVTGRTHQIRVHFSHIGNPLAGDDMYGGNTQLIQRQALHCAVVAVDDIAKKYGAVCKSVYNKKLPESILSTEKETDNVNTVTNIGGKTIITCYMPQDIKYLLQNDINETQIMENIVNSML